METGEFPKLIRLSGRTVVLLESEITDWRANQIAWRDVEYRKPRSFQETKCTFSQVRF